MLSSPAGSSAPSRPSNEGVMVNTFVLQKEPEKEHPWELREALSRHNCSVLVSKQAVRKNYDIEECGLENVVFLGANPTSAMESLGMWFLGYLTSLIPSFLICLTGITTGPAPTALCCQHSLGEPHKT